MATVMSGGNHIFDSLAYDAPHPATQQFIQQQINTGTHLLTEAGARFMETSRSLYEKISGSEAMRIARAAARAHSGMWNVNRIKPLTTIADFQHPPKVMERWIMAEPTVRQLYHEQRCDGYSESYIDPEPGLVGEAHYDYRRVMNGMVQEHEEGGWYANCYYDEMLLDEEELNVDEQVDIIESWTNIVSAIRNGKEDPTSKWNSDL